MFTDKDIYVALHRACAIAENLSNWDKSPQREWYYVAKAAIKKFEEKDKQNVPN